MSKIINFTKRGFLKTLPILSSFLPFDFVSLETKQKYRKYSCSSAISTLEGIENKQRLQTLSIDNAWSNKNFLFYLILPVSTIGSMYFVIVFILSPVPLFIFVFFKMFVTVIPGHF